MCVSSRIVTPVKRHGILLFLYRSAMHDVWQRLVSAVCYYRDELHAQPR